MYIFARYIISVMTVQQVNNNTTDTRPQYIIINIYEYICGIYKYIL